MKLAAIVALFKRMAVAEFVPMFALVRGENPGSGTKRADRIERRQYRRPDKIRSILNPLQCLDERGVGLECDNL